MLVNGNTILAPAAKHGFAVPAFNISDWSMFVGIMDICEQKEAPVIIAIHPDEVSHITDSLMSAIIERAHRSSVPVAIHWDHGGSYEQILHAIQIGFTSVMIDGSLLPYDDNVALTKKVVDAAHAVGLSVEGELGTIGKTDGYAEAGADTIIYTEPEDAVNFVAQTGVDSLAIAIGTRHGIYPPELKAELKLDLLQRIDAAVDVPLVLHGGSNNPDSEIEQACHLGINKVNISSDIKVAYFTEMRTVLADRAVREPNVIQPPCVAAMNVVAAQKIDLFGAASKASLY